MSDKPDNGGPAFPLPDVKQAGGDVWMYRGRPGMSLRDWFAGMALQTIARESLDYESAAEDAYNFADAMLKARQS